MNHRLFDFIKFFSLCVLLIVAVIVAINISLDVFIRHSSKPKITSSSTDYISPSSIWQMAGLVKDNINHRLDIKNTNLSIIDLDKNHSQSNSPINLYGSYMQVKGDFQINIRLSNIKGDVQLSLYGQPPIIEDEFRAELATLNININSDRLLAQVIDQNSNSLNLSSSVKIYSNSNHTLTITDTSGIITINIDNNVPAIKLSDNGIFSSNNIWFGLNALSYGGKFSVNKLESVAINSGRIYQKNSTDIKIRQINNGFAVLAQKVRPGFKIGTSIAEGPLIADSNYQKLVGNYNSVTTENAGKFQFIHPLQGNNPNDYNFNDMDAIVSIAQKSGIDVHGHTLIFGDANPMWLINLAKTSPSALNQIMTDHINTVMTHYKNKVNSWDVVNEPLADNTSDNYMGLRQNIWYNSIGPNYIENALIVAHKANPKAQLWINEFGLESDDDRFNVMLNILKKLKAEGVYITGLGFQSHIDINDTDSSDSHIDVAKLHSHFKSLQNLGLQARISELDVSSPSEYPIYGEVIRSCLQAINCQGVTTWGITDKYSSSSSISANGNISTNIGLPWDQNENPLPVVEIIKNSLLFK